MELSKETYPSSPEKKDIQSVVSDIMQDETIVGKQAKKSPENPPEKKKRGRPRKNPKKEDEETTQKEVPVKKSRGRPRKNKDTPTETIQKQSQTETIQKQSETQTLQKQQTDLQTDISLQKQQTDSQTDPQNDIIPFIQHFSSTHPLHKLPHNTIKYIIFLIQLFQNNPLLYTTLPKHTLHTLLHTIYSSPPTHTHTHTKHFIFSALSTNVDTELNTEAI